MSIEEKQPLGEASKLLLSKFVTVEAVFALISNEQSPFIV